LLRERHPAWTVEQIKSALELTGGPVYSSSSHTSEVTSIRQGGGLIYLPRADDPKIFAAPTGISFGLLHPGGRAARSVRLTNAGGGAGTWSVAVEQRGDVGAVSLTAPATVAVPANLALSASVGAGAAESDVTGFVVLTKGPNTRRIPFWLRVTSPQLPRHRQGRVRRTGTYRGNTSRQQALVDTYRYPDNPSGAGIPADLRGPEEVFRFRLTRRVANFGIAVLAQAPGVSIQPRVVASGDENRLTGYPALPINLNPYLAAFFHPAPAAGAVLPEPGAYDLVFDSTSRANAGRFTFRFWINDKTRPTVRLLTRRVSHGGSLRLRVADRGSGVDPALLDATVDGVQLPVSYSRPKRVATVSLARIGALTRGRHKLVFQASDYQETRNMEDVGPILPNTRTLTTRFRVR